MTTTTKDYYKSEEWTRAEDATEAALGFRILDRSDTHVVTAQVLQFTRADDKGERVIKSQIPVDHWALVMWREAVRLRIDHNGACKLAWQLYMAATGETIDSFNGMPEGGPVNAVRSHVARLHAQLTGREEDVRRMEPVYNAAMQVRISDGSYSTEIAGVIISKQTGQVDAQN